MMPEGKGRRGCRWVFISHPEGGHERCGDEDADGDEE
jgi:hypothetical protein